MVTSGIMVIMVIMVMSGFQWLPKAVDGYQRLWRDCGGYKWFMVISGYQWFSIRLPEVVHGY